MCTCTGKVPFMDRDYAIELILELQRMEWKAMRKGYLGGGGQWVSIDLEEFADDCHEFIADLWGRLTK